MRGLIKEFLFYGCLGLIGISLILMVCRIVSMGLYSLKWKWEDARDRRRSGEGHNEEG